ncbi:MAG: glycoside hydrolase family 18 [Alistipes sp.]
MKNINRIVTGVLLLGFTALVSSCSDWTDMESLEIKQPTIDEQNPALYAAYLASLKAYKQTDHKIVYATFDNREKTPGTRAQHISILPDSLDIVSLQSAELDARELDEIAQVRTKGTRVVYTISYESIRAQYDIDKAAFDAAQVKPAEDAGEETPPVPTFMPFGDYLTAHLDTQIARCDQFSFDGLTFSYTGRALLTLPEAQKEEHLANQNIMLTKVGEWAAAHPSKLLIFEGVTANLADRALLAKCSYIIVPTLDVNNVYALDQRVLQALVADVPTQHILVGARPFSLDKEDLLTGYFADGSPAVLSTAYWIVNKTARYTKAGLAIYDVQTDYFYRTSIYKYTRGAIDIMNPSAKN